jgi:hypothetical protein
MTRQEAYKRLAESQAGRKIEPTDIPISKFCDYVEALGLIKFTPSEPDDPCRP